MSRQTGGLQFILLLACFSLTTSILLAGPIQGIREVQVAFSPRGDALPLILRELRAARHSVDAALFYLSHPELIDTLCRIAANGRVRVRILTDVEAARPADRHILDRLAQHGARVYVLPVPSGKMHLKCAVLDGATVITGAANWTPQAFERNIEDTLVLRSTDLAQRYQARFERLVAQVELMAATNAGSSSTSESATREEVAVPDAQSAASAGRAEVFFSPASEGPKRLSEQIAAASNRVDVAMYILKDPAMIRVLGDKARSGTVAVRLLADAGMLSGSLRPILQELAEAGVEITCWGDDRKSLHLKSTVIDGRYVWTGSANWTPGAFDRNVEDMLLIDSPSVAETYLHFLDAIRPEAQAFQTVGQAPVEVGVDSRSMRDGFLVGLPPTGPRTNWSGALSKQLFPSFDTFGSLQYLPDERYFPVLMDLLRAARQSVLIAMYVFPEPKGDEPLKMQLVKALASAAQRGVYVYLALHMPPGEGDALARGHEDWAESLRAQGVDVRLHVPTVPLHTKCVVVDLAKVLIGSHNWTEGALSGTRIYETSALLVLPRQDRRWADYVLGLETVADMRSRAHWQEELRRIRQLSGLRGKSQEAYLQQLEGAP